MVIVAAACGSSKKASTTTAAAGGSSTTAAAGGASTTKAAGGAGDSVAGGAIKCSQQYKGKTVHIASPVRGNDQDPNAIADFTAAYDGLAKCTGLTIVFDGTDQFETQIKVLVAGGNPPDVIDFPQPGLMNTLASKNQLFPLPDAVAQHVKSDFIAGWDTYSTVGGKIYGMPGRANIKSLVWYSPADFKAKGYAIPQTLDEMKALSDKIVADGGTPWCAGIESGVATGWPVTDWFEDGMLRFNTPEDYDNWVAGKLKFSDPKVVKVADWVGSYLKNSKYVGGDNAVKEIATTKFQSGGLAILDHKCYMHRQASFYADIWPKGTTIGPDGQVNVFYLPVAKAGDKKVMLGAGDIYAAGTNKPESFDTLLYTGSSEFIAALDATKAPTGRGELSPRKDFDPKLISNPTIQGFAQLLKSSEVFRFDGSDLMPSAVGAGTFWTESTKWITGESTADMLSNIDKSWPAS
jgi:alpha-glucoside transport system substrate-binding protein